MATEETPKPKRRLLKPTETVREVAAKQEVSASKPRRLTKTRRVGTAPFRGIAWIFRQLGKFKPFRIIGYILVPPYFRNSWRELRMTTWPTLKQSRQLTTAVMLFAIVFGVLVAGADYGLDKLFKQVLIK
ncbi:MAG TPA: preprotein translocase subunit SecE [Candidatus Saccharimonadales bacterium]|nr:preprotein translocase subunit SecE [Candidatus Saccharimonadales bacterium]